MARRFLDRIRAKLLLPVAGALYGGMRAADVYAQSVESGHEMTLPHVAGYALGAVLVWSLAGLLAGLLLDRVGRRRAGSEPKAVE